MYRVRFMVRGIAPLLFNGWTKAGLDQLRTSSRGRKYTDAQRVEEALEKLHRGDDGGLLIPSLAFEYCIAEGARLGNVKEGRASFARYLAATVFADGDLALGAPVSDITIHECVGRRPPLKGAACLIKRPMLQAGWEATGTLNVTDDRRDPENLRRSVEEGGLLCGLGSWRPKFGRFLLTHWEVQQQAPQAVKEGARSGKSPERRHR